VTAQPEAASTINRFISATAWRIPSKIARLEYIKPMWIKQTSLLQDRCESA